MKKLTAKQRAQIYREAAEAIYNEIDLCGCGALHKVLDKYDASGFLGRMDSLFPDFMLFKPENKAIDVFWWDRYDPQTPTTRITALLLCEQMALNP